MKSNIPRTQEQPNRTVLDRLGDNTPLVIKGVAAIAFAGAMTPVLINASHNNNNADALDAKLPTYISAEGFTSHGVNQDAANRTTDGWGSGTQYAANEVPMKLEVKPGCTIDDVVVHFTGTPEHVTGITNYTIDTYKGGVAGEDVHHRPTVTGGQEVTYTFANAADFAHILGTQACGTFADQVNQIDGAQHF